MKHTAFPKGMKWHFETENWAIPQAIGIHLNSAVLMPQVGMETILVLKEQRDFISGLRRQGPFSLNVKSGAVRTSAGPILFMIWWFHPLINNTPYAAYELLISPSPYPPIVKLLEDGASQTHLHLVILDERQEIFDVVEFANVYGLGSFLETARQMPIPREGYSFERAKQAFKNETSLESFFTF